MYPRQESSERVKLDPHVTYSTRRSRTVILHWVLIDGLDACKFTSSQEHQNHFHVGFLVNDATANPHGAVYAGPGVPYCGATLDVVGNRFPTKNQIPTMLACRKCERRHSTAKWRGGDLPKRKYSHGHTNPVVLGKAHAELEVASSCKQLSYKSAEMELFDSYIHFTVLNLVRRYFFCSLFSKLAGRISQCLNTQRS